MIGWSKTRKNAAKLQLRKHAQAEQRPPCLHVQDQIGDQRSGLMAVASRASTLHASSSNPAAFCSGHRAARRVLGDGWRFHA